MESMQLKGTNGILYLYEDKIIISRKTFGGFAAFGIVGDKTIFYNSIQGIEYSGGILRIIPKGCDVKSYKSINYSDIRKAQRDSNVILLTPSKTKLAERICETINRKVNETYSSTKNINTRDNANEIREFKKLLDEGIITQEEFQRKKQELLK